MSVEFYPTREITEEEFLAKIEADGQFGMTPAARLGDRWRLVEDRLTGNKVYVFLGYPKQPYIMAEIWAGGPGTALIALGKALDVDWVSQYHDEFIARNISTDDNTRISWEELGPTREEALARGDALCATVRYAKFFSRLELS